MHRLLSSALLLAGFAVAQQPICVSGTVTPVPGPTICQQGETHWLPAAGVYLRSSAINLQAHAGRTVQVTGVDVGLVCRVLDVQQVADPAPVELVQCGLPMLGCAIKLRVQGAGLGFALIAADVRAALVPFGCGGAAPIQGAQLLGLPATLIAAPTASGSLTQILSIPNSNALLGAVVRFQGAHATIGPLGPVQLSNAVEVTVTPLLPPCAPLNC